MTVSLDGFINDRDGSVDRLYLDLAEIRNRDLLQESTRFTGVVVMGRHAYDTGGGDFTDYEFQVPIFAITREVPQRVAKGESDKLSFSFVIDGFESAIEEARAATGDKDVTVMGGENAAQQCIRAKLVDEIQIEVMPVLPGGGLRLFEHLADEQIELGKLKVMETSAVTPLKFRVVK